MKYVFVINPNSGKENSQDLLLSNIEKNTHKLDYEVYITKYSGDAARYVDEYCKNHSEETVFCACGGDGTINEVASGMANHPHAILACYPCGSGNDFVKVYGGKEPFLNDTYLLNGQETKIDLMQVNDKFSINVINYGFEVKVCDTANKIKRKKIIGGKHSYTTGILVAIFKSMKNFCKIYANDELIYEGDILLSTFANGKYVGGNYCCAPYSNNEDGLLEVTYVKPISIFKFLSVVNYYKKGTHLSNPKFNKFITYMQSNKITIETIKETKICIDGEIYSGNRFEITNHKQKIRFLRPKL